MFVLENKQIKLRPILQRTLLPDNGNTVMCKKEKEICLSQKDLNNPLFQKYHDVRVRILPNLFIGSIVGFKSKTKKETVDKSLNDQRL